MHLFLNTQIVVTILVARSTSVKKRHDEDMISLNQITQIINEQSRKHVNKIYLIYNFKCSSCLIFTFC